MLPHIVEPPYFTIDGGMPRPDPNPRKARPETMIDRHRQARTIKGSLKASFRVAGFEVVLNMPAARLG